MNNTDFELLKDTLQTKLATIVKGSDERGDIVIQHSADAGSDSVCRGAGFGGDAAQSPYPNVSPREGRASPRGRGHVWDLSNLRGVNQRETIAGSPVGGVVPTLPRKIGSKGGRGPWR